MNRRCIWTRASERVRHDACRSFKREATLLRIDSTRLAHTLLHKTRRRHTLHPLLQLPHTRAARRRLTRLTLSALTQRVPLAHTGIHRALTVAVPRQTHRRFVSDCVGHAAVAHVVIAERVAAPRRVGVDLKVRHERIVASQKRIIQQCQTKVSLI